MSMVTTRKGDGGMTGTYSGERVPKHHLVTETVGSLDEANSLLGLARASVEDKRTKRIIHQVQKHLLVISAEVSHLKISRAPKGVITDVEVDWLDRLVEDLEESLSLPPGFVVFGQQRTASQIDVARTSIRKAERSVSRMLDQKIVGNKNILRYLNRLSDLMFLLACLSEKDLSEQKKVLGSLVRPLSSGTRMWTIVLGALALIVLITITLTVLFHDRPTNIFEDHLKGMENVHR